MGSDHKFPKDHPLRPLFLADRADGGKPLAAVNMLLRHGALACLEYGKSHDPEKARRLSNPDVSPHLTFVDLGGHGYATVRVAGDSIESEFVCIPRPLERIEEPSGPPLRYRVVHRASLWAKGERPRLDRRIVEGDPELSI